MDNRYGLYAELIDSFDEGCDLCSRYDSMPHQYGGEILYQSEMHFLQAVGDTPNITITVISQQLGKTKSACSQMVRKLIKKNLIVQERNQNNNREYFSDEELLAYISIQKHLNGVFAKDVEEHDVLNSPAV